MLSWLCAGGLILVLSQAPAPAAKPISNFWVHLTEILDAEESKPLSVADPGARFPPPRTYVFDAISHIRPGELVRAATEGIRDARQKLHDQPEEVVTRQCRENIQRCLEYYPLLVTREDDLQPLLAVLENPRAEPVLRLYLLERVTAGVVPRSNFGDYFQEVLRRDPERVNKVFEEVVSSLQESAESLRTSMEAWYRYVYQDYEAWFQRDPNILAYTSAHGGAAPRPIQLRDTPELALSPANQAEFAERTQFFVRMATAMSAQLNPAVNRPEPIKAAAVTGIEKMLAEVPFENPEAVRALLTPAATPVSEVPPAEAASTNPDQAAFFE
jgi:hypothetical protein